MEFVLGVLNLLTNGLIWAFFAFVEYLDWHGRMEVTEQKHPKLFKIVEARPFRLVMLMLLLTILLADGRALWKWADTEPLIVNVKGFSTADPGAQIAEIEQLRNDLKLCLRSNPSPVMITTGPRVYSTEPRFAQTKPWELARDATVLANAIRQLANIAINQPWRGQSPAGGTPNPVKDYAARWEGDAIAYRDEMIRRLTKKDGTLLVKRESGVDNYYDLPTNPIGLNYVASDLARLAAALPFKPHKAN
jgi:hypothetical protein